MPPAYQRFDTADFERPRLVDRLIVQQELAIRERGGQIALQLEVDDALRRRLVCERKAITSCLFCGMRKSKGASFALTSVVR